MKTHLYNVAHPLAESGKPIFIPFGEWNYDGQSRQRLDRAHGEKIANELNARVAKGDPGIPVYQGHPDVPALAAKYPDKGALGWITRIELVNESPDGRAVPGLALTVEWDRDPGRGFRWFSPYWLANSRDGGTYIVDEIASIGLVNNPNIPEFRLANEGQPMKKKLNPAIVELAAKHDRLANSVDANGMEHVEAGSPEGGQFAGKEGSGMSASDRKRYGDDEANRIDRSYKAAVTRGANAARRASVPGQLNQQLLAVRRRLSSEAWARGAVSGKYEQKLATWKKHAAVAEIEAMHKAAILRGWKYNPKTRYYE